MIDTQLMKQIRIALLGTFILIAFNCVRRFQPITQSVVGVQEVQFIPRAEFQRGMWVRAVSIASPDSIERILAVARKLDITDIYVQSVVAGYAYYNSDILPRSQYLSEISPVFYDPLDSLCKVASRDSIRVHAWINTLLVWSLKNPPDSLNHIFYRHPEWFIKDVLGKNMHAYTYNEWIEAGLEGLYLDPAHIKVQEYVSRICAEIAEKYPVYGIHLDFIRYPGTLWGLDNNDTAFVFGGLDGYNVRWLSLLRYPQMTFKQRWLAWHNWKQYIKKSTKLAEIVEKIAISLKPKQGTHECLLTAAVFARPNLALYRFGQNWGTWTMLDYPIIMSYCDDLQSFVDIVQHTRLIDTSAIYGIGLLWENIDTVAFMQTQYIEEHDTKGMCYFDFTNLDTLVDLAVLTGQNMSFHYTQQLDTISTEPVYGVFQFKPPLFHSAPYVAAPEDTLFARFLFALTLDLELDLARLGITLEEYKNCVFNDMKAFRTLDSLIFPLRDTLIIPPSRIVAYEFYPWDDQDTLIVLTKAKQTKSYTDTITVYPQAMSILARAAFASDIRKKTVEKTLAGIYALYVIEEHKGGSYAPRQHIDRADLRVYASWTIMQILDKLLCNE